MIIKQFVDSFPAHFFVEMYYNRVKKNGGFIYEETLDRSHFAQLCESYGVFNGCEETTKQIIGYDKNPISKAPSYNIIKQKLSYVLYHLTDFERNAYIAQIKGELEACDKTFWDIKDAFEYIKTTVPYRNYQTIFRFCSELCGIENNKIQKDILNYISELSNYNFKTYDNFRNWLTVKMKRYQRKFNNILPKIAAEYLTISESFNPSINYLI